MDDDSEDALRINAAEVVGVPLFGPLVNEIL